MERFHISIYSDFEEFWRYNIIVMSSASVGGEAVELLKSRSDVAPIGASLLAPPDGYDPNRRIELHHVPAESPSLYIYVLPHSFPAVPDKDTLPAIADYPPFGLRVEVKYGDDMRHAHTYEVDQWSGTTIQVNL